MTPISTTRKRVLRKWLLRIGALMMGLALLVVGVNYWMVRSTITAIRCDAGALPDGRVALVLGTRARMSDGVENLHFVTRMDAAATLYQSGKVRHLILSGDNHTKGYDEPADMKQALLRRGIPESAMTLDCAGFRTLDSMARARKVFKQERIIVVTETFHAARSVFLARHNDLDAVVYCAKDLPAAWQYKTVVREVGARVKAALDVFVLRRGPHFLGEPILIPSGDS